MIKLFVANLKMMIRGRQALFWSLFFPLMFTIIFGFFFGGNKTNVGTVALINNSQTELATNIEKSMIDANLFKIQKETDINLAKDNLKKNKIISVVEIPADFGSQNPAASNQIMVINDPSNAQANMVVTGFLDKFLTAVNFRSQNAKPIYSIKIETTADESLNYFDFVLVGLIGLALMNSSIQGIAITMAKNREDKILKRITTTPLKSWKFVFAEVLSRLVINLIQVSLILGIGIYFFDAHILGNIFLVFLFALLGGLLFQAIGFSVASFSRTTDAAQGMSVAISIPMMFLAGVFFPIDQLPKWLFSIVQYLPLAPLLRMIRQIALENTSPFINPSNIIIVLGWIVITLFIAIRKFRLADE
ncbi:MAG: ABC transporter permease [Patescibacteria group bacterium]